MNLRNVIKLCILRIKWRASFVSVWFIPTSVEDYKQNPQGMFCVFFYNTAMINHSYFSSQVYLFIVCVLGLLKALRKRGKILSKRKLKLNSSYIEKLIQMYKRCIDSDNIKGEEFSEELEDVAITTCNYL